jgi:transcriptional regulator with XRE-family HTH domain
MRRMMLGLSQTDLGKTCGITFQQIQKYEKGSNRVSASRLQEFSKILDAPVSFFFDGLPSEGSRQKNPVEELAQQLLATREGIDLTKAFVAIKDKSLRQSIVTMIERIANREVAPDNARGRVGK